MKCSVQFTLLRVGTYNYSLNIRYVVFLIQTAHRETRSYSRPDFIVSLSGFANCLLSSIVVSQKLSLLAKW